MTARGIRLRLGTRAARCEADTVVLADGERIEGATVICTVGTKPNPLVATLERNLALATRRGRIETNPDMSVRGMPGLWAIGDCARVANAATDRKGAMASIGHMKGVAQVYGFSFSGLPAWLAWRALYLMRMPTLGRKLRLWAHMATHKASGVPRAPHPTPTLTGDQHA
ncbi:FAD-dependent oxidoreductase [Cupriavidus sp. IK-TO18]|uniref:FAD-dependent oxidoreductase n=1 Tax=Cupriavidus sp. IK-TO18 TaxID=2782182 RepID=UPI002102625F|nr:FAD-dependent oxidoreductase [Cupriavidus sp. IK-TO18]